MYQIYHTIYCTLPYTMYFLLCMAIIKVCTFLCVWDPHGLVPLSLSLSLSLSDCGFKLLLLLFFYCPTLFDVDSQALSREMWLGGWVV